MVEQKPDIDSVFKALADPARRAILAQLSRGSASIGNLADPLDMSFAGAAKHVSILVEAKLVHKEKVGRSQVCSLNPRPLTEVRDWLDHYATFWTAKLDILEAAVSRYNDEQ
jgi:DNA-binding transcriptional ArsR family regulator